MTVAVIEPDPGQRQVIDHESGPLLVLGAAGTGKTATLAEAVAARIRSGVPAESILVLAFGRRSAAVLRDRIALLIGGGAMPTVTTFHAFALSLVTTSAARDPDGVLPRLLSGAEEDVRIRDLLLGAIDDGAIEWPDDLAVALPTLGLANDVRAFLARVRELQLDPADLVDAGRALGHPEWSAIAQFADMEDEVMALEGVIDYSRLIALAVSLAAGDDAASLRSSLRCIYVDDAHEADPLQVRLLEVLAPPGGSVVAFADPDSSVYAFRGADREAILRLLGAHTTVLERGYRGGVRLRDAIRSVQRGTAAGSLPADTLRRYRSLEPGPLDDEVAVISYDSSGDLAAHVGRDLRMRHLSGLNWDHMAVLVRGQGDVEVMRRGLEMAGVPTRVMSDDVPLRAEPAVATLLTALEVAVDPATLTPDVAVDIVSGPIGSIDPINLRALMRALRQSYREAHPGAEAPGGTVLLAAELARAIDDPTQPVDAADSTLRRVREVGVLLGQARRQALEGAVSGEILWTLWSGTGDTRHWPERLRHAALAGHRSSSHDLDAIGALFDAAERFTDRYSGVVGAPAFLASLAGQRVPAESVSARAADMPAVVIATAHLAVGRSWDHVVIVGAQEGMWPSLRGRSNVLHIDQLDGLVRGLDGPSLARESAAAQVADERRLFAFALSRAERSACVAVVASEQMTGEQPSRFVEDLGLPVSHVAGRPARPLTLDGLVAELRTAAESPELSEALRGEAARRLATLADATDDGEPLVPLADPAAWWGLRERTEGTTPVRPADRPVALSASALEGLQACPRRWFLQREAHADSARSGAVSFGSIVHALAEAVARGELPADPDVLEAQADRVWEHLPFDAPWYAVAEREALREALRRFCAYHRSSTRVVAASEQRFEVSLPLESSGVDSTVVVRGAIDRLEIDDDGRAHAVDLKTGKDAPSDVSVGRHTQLALYQAAILGGGLDAALGATVEPGGARLVHLRIDARQSPGSPKVQEQPALACGDVRDAPILSALQEAVDVVRAESFPAVPSSDCDRCSFLRTCPAQAIAAEVIS